MSKKDLFVIGTNDEGITLPPRNPGSGSAAPSLNSGEVATRLISPPRILSGGPAMPVPPLPAEFRLTQAIIDGVLSEYEDELADSGSDHSRFFQALSSGQSEADLEVFSRVYRDLHLDLYTVEDYLVYARKASAEIGIPSISEFSKDSRAARLAGMREKIYNGIFPEYGNLHAFIVQEVFNDRDSQLVLSNVQEGDEVLRQGNSLLLKPRVSYYGGDAYETYAQAAEDYWTIADSHFTGTFLSSVTTRTATIIEGNTRILSVSPNVTGISTFNKIYKVQVSGETGEVAYNASVRNKFSTSLALSASHRSSGDITFKAGLPTTYQTDMSKSIIDALFNRHSGNRPYSEAPLMADPARKPSYTSGRSLNREIDSIGRGLFERLSRDEILSELSSAVGDIVDYYESEALAIDYEDVLDLPDISAFVTAKLAELNSIATKEYGLGDLRKLKFYKYVMAPFVGISSGASFTKETNISSELSALKSAISAFRDELIESGKFDPAQ
jgi:hypothetical protein